MSNTFAFISTGEIKHKELIEFLVQRGATIHPDEVYDGRISQENKHVWVRLDSRILTEFEADDRELLMQKLAGRPRTSIILEVSRTPGSQQLAVDFACKCAERWPVAVVSDLLNRIFSTGELFQLRSAGKGFDG